MFINKDVSRNQASITEQFSTQLQQGAKRRDTCWE